MKSLLLLVVLATVTTSYASVYMPIWINANINGQVTSSRLTLNPLDTIGHIKEIMEQREGIPASSQTLIWNRKNLDTGHTKQIVLDNKKTLASYKIPSNTYLTLDH